MSLTVYTASWTALYRAARADALDVRQSPREAQFNAALDELARAGLPVPTEAEALAEAEGRP